MRFPSIVFSVKQVFRPNAFSCTLGMREFERRSVDEIAKINWCRRKALLASAFRSAFYRKRFADVGLQLGDIKNEVDWEKIPVLTRRDIQENMEEMVCDGISRGQLSISSTGGSTGEPLRLYRPKGIPYDAFAARMLRWWGVGMWENSCYIFRHGYSGWRKTVNDLMWWPTRRAFLNAASMDEEKCAVFYQHLCRIRPALLVGYVGAVANFADYLRTHNLSFPFQLKAVWTTSAPLPEPLRASLQQIFGAPVYSQYGCCECGHLAAECACQKGMHIHADWRHLEVVKDDGRCCPAGERGNVLISDLLSTDVPLIRYALGDKGRLETKPCPCGCNLPLMAPVSGRVSEAFPMPDGSELSGDYLTTIFDDYPDAVRGFRVVQKKDYSIRVEYIPRDENTLRLALEAVAANLSAITRGQVPVSIERVGTLPHDRGKMRYVVTEVMQKGVSGSSV